MGFSGFFDRNIQKIVGAAAILAALYLASLYSYLLFHTLAELFSIVIGATIFVLAWNFRQFYHDSFLIFIGTSYLFFSFIDLLHTLAFKGMGVFPGYDTDLPTQLWIAARYLQSLSLLIAPIFLGRRVAVARLMAGFALVVSAVLASIFVWDIFPASYIEGSGLTPFKIASEYVIVIILATAIVGFFYNRRKIDRRVLQFLGASTGLTMLSELAFTFYIDVYGFSNLVGHYLKIFASFLVYKALIETEAGSIYAGMAQLRETEQALRLSEQTLKKANADLERYADKLQRSNQELEQFAFIASHDLQEPLRKIIMFGDAIQHRSGDSLPDETREHLGRMQSAARRMGMMVDGLLELSRVTRHGGDYELAALTPLVREVVVDLEARIRDTGGLVQVDELPAAEVDAPQIRRLFLNLLGNGLKYHRKGVPPIVRVSGRVEPGKTPRVILTIEDNGIGFDEQLAEVIFQPFQRLHGRSEYEGTGLGLAICKKIVERHHGKIEARSRPGQGSQFVVTLPVYQGDDWPSD